MSRLGYAVLVLLLALGGCVSYVPPRPLQSFQQRYVQFDAALGWQVRQVGRDLVIDGVFKNLRYDYMNGVEIRVVAIDPAGKATAHAVTFLIPDAIPIDTLTPFSLRLLTTPAPGSKLRFTYKYAAYSGAGNGTGGRGGGDAAFWMQSFDATIPALAE